MNTAKDQDMRKKTACAHLHDVAPLEPLLSAAAAAIVALSLIFTSHCLQYDRNTARFYPFYLRYWHKIHNGRGE